MCTCVSALVSALVSARARVHLLVMIMKFDIRATHRCVSKRGGILKKKGKPKKIDVINKPR